MVSRIRMNKHEAITQAEPTPWPCPFAVPVMKNLSLAQPTCYSERNATVRAVLKMLSGRTRMKDTETSTKLRAWQKREKLSQPQAAAKLNAPLATYRNWVTGRRNPSTGMRAVINLFTGEAKT